MELPITNELKRQIFQGFLEEKRGLVRPDLGFQFNLGKFEETSPSLEITAYGIVYRGEVGGHIGLSGSELLAIGKSYYSGFTNHIRSLAELLGPQDEYQASIFKDNDRCWEWKLTDAESLDEALRVYRFGELRVTSPQRKLRFNSHVNPNMNYGTISLRFELTLPEESLGSVEQIERYLPKLTKKD